MRTKRFLKAFIILLLSLWFLTACGGGESADGGNSSNVAEGGIGGTGISIGPISAFGSLFVNGIEFQTDNTVIIVNGQTVTEDFLKIGMVVRVEGTITPDSNTGNALRIDFNENVRGPVQSLDNANNTLIVLGQTVTVDQLTVLDGIVKLSDLNVGDVLNVSGLVDADGTIRATWIAREPFLGEFEVMGRVANLNLATQTFTIGAITVDYSQALRLDIPEGRLENGLLLEVKGTFVGVQEILMASHVESEDEFLSADVGTTIEIEGFIDQFNNPFDFQVAQLSVTTTTQTVFTFGGVDDLALGVKVEVKGELDANNVLVLEEVSFRDIASERTPAGRIEIKADVEEIDVVKQTVTMLGLSIQSTQSTQFRDKREAMIPFGLQDLSLGDHIAMSGFLDLATNTLMAEVLRREPFRQDSQVMLTGPVDSVNADVGTFSILGITVLIDKNTVYEDEKSDGSEEIMSAEQFFANIQQLEPLIEAQGILTGDVLLAKSLEIEL